MVIPVLNGAGYLPRCLKSLELSEAPAREIIVVDDGSTDDSAAVAESLGAVVFRTLGGKGPAAARNLGAARASGDILVFVDADVCVHRDTLGRMRARLENDPGLDAVIGSYDDQPAATDLVSQYKNLLHHYVHQRGKPEAATFWSGCGAIRRQVFAASGGFDESYPRPCIEDIELGCRLRQAGRRIALDPAIQAKHLKHWRLLALLRTDIFDRALPWTRLILRSAWLPDDLNVRVSERVSAALVMVSVLLVAASWFAPVAFALAWLPIIPAVVLNWTFYRYLVDKRGWAFLTGALPLHLAYYLYSTLAFGAGCAMHLLIWRWQPKSATLRPKAEAARVAESRPIAK